MKTQNFDNHKKLDLTFLFGVGLSSIIGAILFLLGLVTLLIVSIQDIPLLPWYMACMIIGMVLIGVSMVFMARKMRSFATKNQDRIIRFEEGFRYYVLTGKQIDPRLTTQQLIALRFAPDDEFLDLCQQTIDQHLTPVQIKKAIKNRKSDHERV